MRQAIMTAPGKIELREVPEPGKLKDNEVLLRIHRIGVCGSDLSDFRLSKAVECGITYTANLKNENFEDAITRVFGNDGFQVGLEAAGVESSLSALVKNIEKGGTVVVIGVYEKQPVVHMGFVGEHELNIIGSMMYLHEDYQEAVRFISEGKITTAPLVTGHFPLEKYIDAYKFIEREGDRSLKIMIDVKE